MSSRDLVSFGSWLKRRREALDLTQQELAAATGCSVSTVRKMEAGVRRPSKQVAELLAASLRVSAAELAAFMRFAREGAELLAPDEPLESVEHQLAAPESSEDRQTDSLTKSSPAPEPANEPLAQPAASLTPPTNLPYYPTSFVGRERVLEQVLSLLWRVDVRLLTLTGPPGIGKTRLAVQLAAHLLQDFSDGVFFVPLASVTNPALVVPAIADVLQVHESPGRSLLRSLTELLMARNILLVLDNFEQVVVGAAAIGELLEAVPRLKLLATSRVPLGLYGEHEYEILPLQLPAAGFDYSSAALHSCEAVQLFVSRAQAVCPDLVLTPENSGKVFEIARRLEGLPLAIELAAVRSKYYDPETLLTLLQHRLGVLTGGPRDLPARHKTVRAAIAWSYDLLDAGQQALFRALGVFVGGFTTDAVSAVFAGAASAQNSALSTLESLIDQSLLTRQAGSGTARFGMLETIREYALEQLAARGEEPEARRRHATYFIDLVRQAAEHSRGPQHATWLAAQEADYDNLRQALGWLIECGYCDDWAAEAALVMISKLTNFWDLRGHLSEGREWFARALENAERLPLNTESHRRKTLLADAWAGAGALARSQSDYAAARECHERSIVLWREIGDADGLAWALNGLGHLAIEQGDPEAAGRFYSESRNMARLAGDDRLQLLTLINLGVVAWQRGDLASAVTLLEESLELARRAGDKQDLTMALDQMGRIYVDAGNTVAARRCHEEALQLCLELGNNKRLADLLANMALRANAEGNLEDTRHYFGRSLELAQALGLKRVVAKALGGSAGVLAQMGLPVAAARVWGADEKLRETLGYPYPPPVQVARHEIIKSAQSQIAPTLFAAAWQEGRALAVEPVVEYVLGVLRGSYA